MNDGNLILLKKGDRLNPNGRTKGSRNFKTIFNEILSLEVTDGEFAKIPEIQAVAEKLGRKLTYREALAIRITAQAIKNPESRSAVHVLDRSDGTPQQFLDITTDGKGMQAPPTIVIENPNK